MTMPGSTLDCRVCQGRTWVLLNVKGDEVVVRDIVDEAGNKIHWKKSQKRRFSKKEWSEGTKIDPASIK